MEPQILAALLDILEQLKQMNEHLEYVRGELVEIVSNTDNIPAD